MSNTAVPADCEGDPGQREHHAEPGQALTEPLSAKYSMDQESRTRSNMAMTVMNQQKYTVVHNFVQAVQFRAATYTPSAACYPRGWEAG
jgi:hypothetical protein